MDIKRYKIGDVIILGKYGAKTKKIVAYNGQRKALIDYPKGCF